MPDQNDTRECRKGHALVPDNLTAGGRCRACSRQQARAWYYANYERARETRRRYRESHLEAQQAYERLYQARKRAERKAAASARCQVRGCPCQCHGAQR